MATKTLDGLIERTSNKYRDSNTVALLGEVNSGKTVVAALVKHTLVNSWVPRTNGKWQSLSRRGQDEINEIIRNMKRGEFPDATPNKNYPKLVTSIYRMEGKPEETSLVLQDMSGESYENFLTGGSYQSTKDRLKFMLEGGADYIPYAKKYIIVIGCDVKEEWDTDISKVAPMISRIRELKQEIHRYDSDEKLHSPVAIIFTKSDVLSDGDKAKSAEDLASDYPELQSSLSINHDQVSLKFFKVSVSTRVETSDERDKRMKRTQDRLKKQRRKMLAEWMRQAGSDIEQRIRAAETQARDAGQGEDDIRKAADKARSNAESEYTKQFNRKHPQGMPSSNDNARWRIKTPLSYDKEEYVKLISWLLDNDGEG